MLPNGLQAMSKAKFTGMVISIIAIAAFFSCLSLHNDIPPQVDDSLLVDCEAVNAQSCYKPPLDSQSLAQPLNQSSRKALSESTENNTAFNPDEPSNSLVELAVQESLVRLRLEQPDEALQELDPLLEDYEQLTDSEKFTLVNGYANFFLAEGQLQDVIELYRSALSLEEISPDETLLLYRTLGQLSMHSERYQDGIEYFDSYFSRGGQVDSAVSLTLARSHNNVGNIDQSFQYLLRHFQLSITEGNQLRPEFYNRTYSELEDVLVQTSQSELAVDLALEIVQIFDSPGSWRNLARIYLRHGQVDEYEQVLAEAQRKGLLIDNQWVNESQ